MLRKLHIITTIGVVDELCTAILEYELVFGSRFAKKVAREVCIGIASSASVMRRVDLSSTLCNVTLQQQQKVYIDVEKITK